MALSEERKGLREVAYTLVHKSGLITPGHVTWMRVYNVRNTYSPVMGDGQITTEVMHIQLCISFTVYLSSYKVKVSSNLEAVAASVEGIFSTVKNLSSFVPSAKFLDVYR